MKKTLLICFLILAGVFVFFSALDRSDYRVEKKLWRIQKDFAQLAQDPKIVPDSQFEALAAQYQALRQKYPQSRLAPYIQFQTAQVYMVKKDFSKARAAFAQALKLYPSDKGVCSAALGGIGNSYELENNVDAAVATYQQIIKEYPRTGIGMEMPMYIANYYFRLNKNTQASAALQTAESYYQRLATQNTDPAARFNGMRFLATTYVVEEKWEAAIKTFSQILLENSRSPYLNWRQAEVILRSINTIAVKKLKNVEQPILIYQSFIEKNPGHPLNKNLKEMIVVLQKLNLEAKTPALK